MSFDSRLMILTTLLLGARASAGEDHTNNGSGNDLREGLVAHYPLDGSAKDKSRLKNDGTICGATETEGHSGPGSLALEFDGVDDYVDLAAALDDVGSLGEGTISLWFRLDQAPNQLGNRPNPRTGFPGVPQDQQITFPVLYLGAMDAVNGNHSLMVHPIHPNALPTAWFTLVRNSLPANPLTVPPTEATRPFFCFDTCYAPNSATSCNGPGNDVLTAGTWYHFAITVDSTGNRGYLNGEELFDRRFNPDRSRYPLAQFPPGPGVPSEASDVEFFDDVLVQDDLFLGRGTWAYSQNEKYLDGAIDEVRIYDRVLSADEIAELYAAEDLADFEEFPDPIDNSCIPKLKDKHDDRWEAGWGDWFDASAPGLEDKDDDWWSHNWW